jgi:FdhD protein
MSAFSDKIDPALAAVRVSRIAGSGVAVQSDMLAVEEPLEIRLGCDVAGRRVHRAVSITMRTPGHDLELAVGFLFTEGLLVSPEQVAGVRACGAGNVARVDLQPGVDVDLARLERHFYTSSSCGVCGKASLEAVRVCSRHRAAEGKPVIDAAVIHRLPAALRAAQAVFGRTGGLHAAALFDTRGNLLCLREDVGRHNALDKLIGAYHAKYGVTLSLPSVVGRDGVSRILEPAMSDDERRALSQSAEILRQAVQRTSRITQPKPIQ